MAWYRNTYRCSRCDALWDDEWSCMCDDECPNCGASDHSPIDSEDLSAFIENGKDGSYCVYYSPPDAAHSADYERFAIVWSSDLAKVLERIAFDLAQPP